MRAEGAYRLSDLGLTLGDVGLGYLGIGDVPLSDLAKAYGVEVAPVTYSRKHLEFLDFQAPDGAITSKAAIGQYGSGKTHVGADAFLELVAQHPDTLPGFTQKAPPISFICGATYGGLVEGAVAELRAQAPEGWIAREVLYGSNPYLEWANGLITKLVTAKVMDDRRGGRGFSSVFGWVDEAQDDAFTAGAWNNIRNRSRHRFAPRPTLLVTGVAKCGTVLEQWMRGKDSATQRAVILRLQDNLHGLHPGMLELIKSGLPMPRLAGDGWQLVADGAIWAHWSEANIERRPLDELVKGKPWSLGIDLGTHASVVAGVKLAPDQHMLVAQLICDNQSPDKIADEIDRRWGANIGPGSTITLDPSLDELHVDAFRYKIVAGKRMQRWPGARIVQHRAGKWHTEDNGLVAVDRAILDANGVIHLRMHESLIQDPTRRGVANAIPGYDGWKHSPLAHTADAVRYYVVTEMPPRLMGGAALIDPDQNIAKRFAI